MDKFENRIKANWEHDDKMARNRNNENVFDTSSEIDSDWQSRMRLRLDEGLHGSDSAPASPTGNISYHDLTWDEDEARSIKRKREDRKIEQGEPQTSGEKLAVMIRRCIKKIEKESRAMMVLAKEHNTKRGIKEIAGNLRTLMTQIMTTEAQEILQTLGRH